MTARLVLLSWLLLSACGHRRALTVDELAKIREHDPELVEVRAFVSDRVIAVHEPPGADVRYAIEGGEVQERSSTRPLRQIVGRRTAGAVVAVTTLHEMPVLWVSFDAACTDAACAFPFVAVEDGRFVLEDAPELPNRAPPRVYRRRVRDRALLTPTKIGSLADANAVLSRTRRGEAQVITLEIRKVSRRSQHASTRRARGFDRPSRAAE
ncbi:MAG: hypothetical protein R3B09_25660 [Nannocystaceae bacterium]